MSWILGTVTSQLPGLIEKYEPDIEKSIVKILTDLKTKHPGQVKIFLDNWRKLNTVIEKTISDVPTSAAPNIPEPMQVDGGKRTRRNRRKHRKHRK